VATKEDRAAAKAQELAFELHTTTPTDEVVEAAHRAAKKGSSKLQGMIKHEDLAREGDATSLLFSVRDPVIRSKVLGSFTVDCTPAEGGTRVSVELTSYTVADGLTGPKIAYAKPLKRFREVLTGELAPAA
jgi:hypothetical protein